MRGWLPSMDVWKFAVLSWIFRRKRTQAIWLGEILFKSFLIMQGIIPLWSNYSKNACKGRQGKVICFTNSILNSPNLLHMNLEKILWIPYWPGWSVPIDKSKNIWKCWTNWKLKKKLALSHKCWRDRKKIKNLQEYLGTTTRTRQM